MNYLKMLAAVLFLLLHQDIYAQTENQPFIAVDSLTFKALAEWTGSKREGKTLSLTQFLSKQLGETKSKAFFSEFDKKSVKRQNGSNQKSVDECACALLVLNKDHLNHPNPTPYPDNGNGSGFGWSWIRVRNTIVAGAVHNENLVLTGNNSGTEYTSGDNSNWSRSRISFNWICLNSGNQYIPADCDCKKELRIEALYDSRVKVSAEVKGAASKAAFTKGEDAAVIFAYDHPNSFNSNPNLQILGAKIAKISTYVQETWNPQAVIDIVELAGTVTAAIVTDGWSQSLIATTLPDQIADIISQPLIFNDGSTKSSSYAYEKILSLNIHDKMLSLKPNIPKTLVIAPTWNVYGRGYGADWTVKVEIASDFALGMLLKLDNSNPYCCIKQTGKYNYGTTTNAPSNVGSLVNSLNSFFNLYGPWQNNVNTSNTSMELVGTINCPPIPAPCTPAVAYSINNKNDNDIAAKVTDNLIINLSNTISCSDNYYISVQQSDEWWSTYGPENTKWIPGSDIGVYGGKSSFNLKQFNSSFGNFSFQAEKFYKVKIAVSDPWMEKTVLLRIKNKKSTPKELETINGSGGIKKN